VIPGKFSINFNGIRIGYMVNLTMKINQTLLVPYGVSQIAYKTEMLPQSLGMNRSPGILNRMQSVDQNG